MLYFCDHLITVIKCVFKKIVPFKVSFVYNISLNIACILQIWLDLKMNQYKKYTSCRVGKKRVRHILRMGKGSHTNGVGVIYLYKTHTLIITKI